MIAPMSDAPLQDMLDLAKRLALEAAALALPQAGQAVATRKADDSVVTEVDRTVQAHILSAIADAYPGHAVCAEEAVDRPGAFPLPSQVRYCWVVDPLDGTRNYASGFPCFSTAIAVLDEGRPVIAVVYEHNFGAMYTAIAGRGAALNDKSMGVDETRHDADMLVGIPSSKDRLTVDVLREWVGTRGIICRNTGSTALHLALVASGALAAAFCKRSKIWDVAAGALLVVEAGGRITDVTGSDLERFDLAAEPGVDIPFLAAAPRTHERLLPSIRAAASSR